MRSPKILFCAGLVLIAISVKAQVKPAIQLPAIFSDNMVLQQNTLIPVWGKAVKGTKITVEIAGTQAETTAQANGNWQVKLSPLPAGGPYVLKVIGKDTIAIKQVMIGEVWLASGQSNMNFNVANLDNRNEVIADAHDENIREFDVMPTVSETPQQTVKGTWKVATAANVPSFSAVAYLFAKHLHRDKKVAVGIIHASWGGTPIESWLSADMLLLHPDFRDSIIHMQNHPEDWAALNDKTVLANAQRKEIVATTKAGITKGVIKTNYNDKLWTTTTYPILSAKLPIPHYRLVWLRKTIDVPEYKIKDTSVNLSLGMVQDQDITYLNGIEVGRSNTPGKRIYKIPASAIKHGKNVIAIRYLCQYGYEKIGLAGDKPTLSNQDSTFNIPLTGEWKYNYAIEPNLPWGVAYQNLPSALYNAMIAPVVPYGIRGILWYQGESNADRFTAYKTLQPLLFTDWRMRWGNNKLPFLFVQLPNLKSGVNWPFMREAQATALNYPYTGMAVGIDVGNPDDVHPKNKDKIALRLYLQARKVAYGDTNLIYTGPIFKSMTAKGDTLYLTFNHTDSGLQNTTELKGFTIAGPDKIFHNVPAVIMGDKVLIKYEGAGVNKPVVRYGWAPSPDCNLYNMEGLPAAPFRTDNW